jgi:hypothetical protein
MPRKPLRSQLNQIRAWVREGRTDAWIAHQLDIPAAELREFRHRHELAPDEEGEELDLRDEIEAEIEAAMDEAEQEEEEELEEEEEEDEAAARDEEGADGPASDGQTGEGGVRKRRRRRRGRGKRGSDHLQGTFDHGETDGYGLWLDPAVKDDPVYAENWAGHRKVEVTIEADQIVIRRV